MAEKLGLGPEVRELKLGTSFTNPKALGFHTLRYDFKPASVDMNQMGTLDVGNGGQVTVTVPPNTVYKGSAKPYQKQCVVVINMDTNEITLEKLSSNVQVKKTRSERPASSVPPTVPSLDHPLMGGKGRKPPTQNSRTKSGPGKSTGKTKSQHLAASLSSVVPKHSPLHASPNRKSPNSTTRLSPNGPNSNNSAASLSMIELEDGFHESMFPPAPDAPRQQPPQQNSFSHAADAPRDRPSSHNHKRNPPPPVHPTQERMRTSKVEREIPRIERMDVDRPPPRPMPPSEPENGVGVLSDSSSSSSSDSSSDSDSSDTEETRTPAPPPPPPPKPVASRGGGAAPLSVPHHLLREDLQLSSESGSDSD